MKAPNSTHTQQRWRRYPTIYEINTWVWLSDLSKKYSKPIDLASVPASEWDALGKLGVDAVWFMGVWERSPAGIAIANQNENLLNDFRLALPDFRTEDNVGSPYCIRRYVVDKSLGGPKGLATARRELANRGLLLVLDYVPNHVAPDHPWVAEHPNYLVRGNADDLRNDPASFVELAGTVFARGRDPFFPAWPDVVQLNAFDAGLRKATIDTLTDIASQCDGVRCDMAMLLLNDIFERTWGPRAGSMPVTDFWQEVIPAVKRSAPGFLFIAEAYWDLEWQLQQQGFDFCYDKRLYDRLEHDSPQAARLHLCADLPYQQKLVRFIENHDEPRAASVFPPLEERTAAIITSFLPGARLFHEGQLEGRKVKLPVFLGRRPEEPPDTGLRSFYLNLLKQSADPAFHEGEWRLCETAGWPDNSSHENLVASTWTHNDDRYLVAVNLSANPVQGRVRLGWDDLKGTEWSLRDALADIAFDRAGDEMQSDGLYVELPPWGFHFFNCARKSKAQRAPMPKAA